MQNLVGAQLSGSMNRGPNKLQRCNVDSQSTACGIVDREDYVGRRSYAAQHKPAGTRT